MRTLKNILHGIYAYFANILYGFPSRKLTVIGVTGTDGKTTTTSLIYHILKTADKKVSYSSTVSAKIGDQTYDIGLHTTTPDPLMVQKFLKQSADHGDELYVMEVTSHALDQHRVGGVNFTYGVLTNITHEHLDYHKTYERYVDAKCLLLCNAKTAIINHDDISFDLVKNNLAKAHHSYITYGLQNESDYRKDIEKDFTIHLSSFNRYNFLAAYAVAKQIGISDEIIKKAMETFQYPAGRMDIVNTDRITYMIDFAHTPNAISEILETVKPEVKGRLIHIFGSAALRDESKRPFMGEASGIYADVVILTEEDYRTEDPEKIAKEIAVGLEKKRFAKIDPEQLSKDSRKVYAVISDREKAIEKAISITETGDYLISTGKGHEKSLCRGTTEYPWDERAVVSRLLKNYGFSS